MGINFGNRDMTLYKIDQHQYIFEQDQPFETVHVLRRGKLELIRNDSRVAIVEKYNAPFGNFELLMEGTRHFGARALRESQVHVLEMTKTDLFEWFHEHPSIHLDELKNVSQVLDTVNRENKSGFERYREIRPMFSPLIEPLVQLLRVEGAVPNKSLKRIIRNHLKIIGQTSKSSSVTVDDITLSENVKKEYQPGDTICEEGEEGEELYLHLDGILSVLKEGQLVANIEKTGILFGEMAPLIDGKRKATVKADTSANIAVLPLKSLPKLFENSPGVARKITNLLINRLEKAIELNDRLREFSKDVTNLFGDPNTLKKQKKNIAEFLDDLSPSKNESQKSIRELQQWVQSEPDIPPGFEARVLGGEAGGINEGFSKTIE